MSRERGPARPPETFRKLLEVESQAFEIELPADTLSGLAGYLAELDRWRRSANLTGRLPPEQLVSHALESVLGAGLITHGARVVDIGSGAGFPGLPLAIARPDLDVTLVEPRAKRCAFLRHVVRTLGLENVRVAAARIEEVVGRTFDVATTRALGHFQDWLSGTPFLACDGVVLAWTTGSAGVEAALGPSFRPGTSLGIPGSAKRRIVAFRREA